MCSKVFFFFLLFQSLQARRCLHPVHLFCCISPKQGQGLPPPMPFVAVGGRLQPSGDAFSRVTARSPCPLRRELSPQPADGFPLQVVGLNDATTRRYSSWERNLQPSWWGMSPSPDTKVLRWSHRSRAALSNTPADFTPLPVMRSPFLAFSARCFYLPNAPGGSGHSIQFALAPSKLG